MYRNTCLERHCITRQRKWYSTSHSGLINPPNLGFSGKSAKCIVHFSTFLSEVYLVSFCLFFLSAAIDPLVCAQAQASMELEGELQCPSPWGGSLGRAFLSPTLQGPGGSTEPAGTYGQSLFLGSGIRHQNDLWGPFTPLIAFSAVNCPSLTDQQHTTLILDFLIFI